VTPVQTDAGTTSPTADLSLGDADPTIADLEDIYLDGTLVLVGCGAAKRDPEDPVDLHAAVVSPDEQVRKHGPKGPAWEARDLYVSNYFRGNRELAETITRWTGDPTTGWAILSAEHGVLEPWMPTTLYDTSIDDIGDDPTNPDHRVDNRWGRRRPDGREIVTEMDRWAADVATGLMRWIAGYRDDGAAPWDVNASTLLVLAGQKYLDPLRERGVFEYGIARMGGDPNVGYTQPLETRYLFEQFDDHEGMGDHMSWVSDATARLQDEIRDYDDTAQAEVGQWTGETRACDRCGVDAPATDLQRVDGEGVADGVTGVYCPDCLPGACNRCGDLTHETGHGTYPLCPDCQTERGGQILEPVDAADHEQASVSESITATDGGDGAGGSPGGDGHE